MKKSMLKKPLMQSATILGSAMFLFANIGTAVAGGAASGEGTSFFGTIWDLILLCIFLPISLAICIAILIGIFLAAVAMVDKEQASMMFADLKKKRMI